MIPTTAISKDSVQLRRATPADANRLAQLGRDTFTATFGPRYPADDLAAFLDENHQPSSYAAWAVDPAYGLWIAEKDGQAIGYTLAGPCGLPHPEVTAACGELKRVYVRPEAQGLQVGSKMLAEAFAWLKRPGRMLWIGVWSENLGAQRLYARYGFEKVGEYLFPVGEVRDEEFIMRRGA